MKVYYIYSDPINERFIEHIINSSKFCISCGELCDDCRLTYKSHAEDISGIHFIPSELPAFIEEPEEYLPEKIKDTDIVVAINIHHDILAALPDLLHENRINAIIIPVEDGDWVPKGLENQVKDALDDYNIQYAFPRPFCALEPTGQPLIDEFIEFFKIGKPVLELNVINGKISDGKVKISTPCGCLWYMNRELARYKPKVDEKLKEVISKAHHSYPCNASMNKDIALDDAPLHIGGYIHRKCVYDAIIKNEREKEFQEIKEELIHLKEKLSYTID